MSKTTKIRRLSNKVSQLERHVGSLEWSNTRLIMESKPIPFKHYTQPPEFRSNNYSEEQSYQKLIDYIYSKMDQLYNDSFERYPYLNLNDIKFVLYIDRRTLLQLSSINGYRDLVSREDGGGFEFIGHKVVEVIGEEHINFVRIA